MYKSQGLLILLTMEILHYYVYHNNTIIYTITTRVFAPQEERPWVRGCY